jgi:hypothetical protein
MARLQLLVVAIVGGALGCAASVGTPDSVARSSRVEVDSFKKAITVASPRVRGEMGRGRYEALIRGIRLTREAAETFQIYVATNHFDDWHHYRTAWDEDGSEFAVSRIGSDARCASFGCRHIEDVGVEVSREYLEARRSHGVRLKLSGPGGEVVIEIPAGYVDGFLNRFDDATTVARR